MAEDALPAGLRTVFDDGRLLVVDKPHGLASQADRDGQAGVFELLRRRWPGLALHHRLDTPASGLLLLGLDPALNGALTDAFRTHTVRREYLAVTVARPREATWAWKLDGKSARTDVELVHEGPGLCVVRLRLHTGRTHQIRRHAAMAGCPLAGDRRYGAEAGGAWPRLALHAAALGLKHPGTGEALAFTSPVPDDLRELWALAGASLD